MARTTSELHQDTMALANLGITGLHEAMQESVPGPWGGVEKHLVRLACDQGHIVTALGERRKDPKRNAMAERAWDW